MDIPKKKANIKQMNSLTFILDTPSRPSKYQPDLDDPKDAKGKLQIGDVTLRKPRKVKFNEMFVTAKK